MKLLILTQKIDINDPVLGFFHRWVEEFSKHFKYITIICLAQGEYNLPNNVKVLSLGKEKGKSRLKYVYNFYKYIWQERKNYDSVFVHMNLEYVLLGSLFWKVQHKKVALWYAHGKTSWSLRLAEMLSDVVFTSSISGFRLPSKKLKIVGQGIDVNKFAPNNKPKDNNIFKLVTVGRISPVKNLSLATDALNTIKETIKPFKFIIIGDVVANVQSNFRTDLIKKIKNENLSCSIDLIGAFPNDKIIPFLQNSDLFLNTSSTGSLDKAILEAMACALPVISCNEAYKELIKVITEYCEQLTFMAGDHLMLAERIKNFYLLSFAERMLIGEKSRSLVVNEHSLVEFSKKIFKGFE